MTPVDDLPNEPSTLGGAIVTVNETGHGEPLAGFHGIGAVHWNVVGPIL
jgi:hypothetical protein